MRYLALLEKLELSYSSIPNSIKTLVSKLQCLTKTELHLSFQNICTESVLALANALQLKTSTNLLELHWTKSRIGSEGLFALGLKTLNLMSNNFDVKVFNIICSGLQCVYSKILPS